MGGRWLGVCALSWLAATATQGGEGSAQRVNIDSPGLNWSFHRNPDTTCVMSGTAVSELRDDAFEVQFRHSRGQKVKLFVLIPNLPRGGTLFMESPVTRERWRIFTDNYVPALDGAQAETLQRNLAGGVSLWFTFEFKGQRVKYETISRNAAPAASVFKRCVDSNILDSLKAETR